MYGTNVVGTGLTLGKVLGGISKGLTIANQVIPLYQQAKPMITNARKVMSIVKEFKAAPEAKTTTQSSTTKVNNSPKTTIDATSSIKKITTSSNSSNPVFFQ